MKSADIQNEVARFFGYRTHLCVPNASWGAGVHECDLLLLTSSGYGVEVEIKISRSDIIADKRKAHHRNHNNPKIKRLYFAIPEALNIAEVVAHIPDHAGIIVVRQSFRGDGSLSRRYCEIVRNDRPNKYARAWTIQEKYELARLGTMRYWTRHAPIEETSAAA